MATDTAGVGIFLVGPVKGVGRKVIPPAVVLVPDPSRSKAMRRASNAKAASAAGGAPGGSRRTETEIPPGMLLERPADDAVEGLLLPRAANARSKGVCWGKLAK